MKFPSRIPVSYTHLDVYKRQAIGFLKSPWYITPLEERLMPTSTARKTLGSLTFWMIVLYVGLISETLTRFLRTGIPSIISLKVCFKGILADPMEAAIIIKENNLSLIHI